MDIKSKYNTNTGLYENMTYYSTSLSTDNTQNEYKYRTVFVLQKTGWTEKMHRLPEL